MTDHLIIPDCQVKPGTDTSHIQALGQYLVETRPDVVVCLGDFWDMHSLSEWDRGKLKFEGRRFLEDVAAGNKAMSQLLSPLRKLQSRQRQNKKAVYNPEMVFLLGNHEQRIQRAVDSSPNYEGLISYSHLDLSGWRVKDFLDPEVIDGVAYAHYFSNPMTGRPWGGVIDTRIKNIGYSFTQGHTQIFQYGRKDLTNGQVINGLVTGAFYTHDEDYKGYQGNNHFRGFVHKRNVSDGDYDLELVRIESLLERYGV